MNNLEKYIISRGGKKKVDNFGSDGYIIKTKNGKVYISCNLYIDRQKISKKFKRIIRALIKD